MPTIVRLIGVYDADGSVVGELSYFIKARLGRAHCALCDITHGRVRERADWRASRADLLAPFVTFHRDDQPSEVASASPATPVVLAETDDGQLLVLADAGALQRCGASPSRLVATLESEAAARGLSWPRV